jgi:putative heme iron utilization protein
MTQNNEFVAVVFDGLTGETITREFTKEEKDIAITQQVLFLAEQEAKQAKIAARQSALTKLAALGLTEEEIGAL